MSTLLDAEGDKPNPTPIWFLWLDVEGDPLRMHTGLGEITFGASETGDPALDGYTFTGLGQLATIGQIQESENGSGPVSITVPGVDPEVAGFKPFIADARRWQFRRAVLWFSYVTADGTGLVDSPEREKTGRMDDMDIEHSGDTCTITLNLEGFAASSGPPLNSRYADQAEIDPDDISQIYVADLSNRQVQLGPAGSSSATSGSGGVIPPSTTNARNIRQGVRGTFS